MAEKTNGTSPGYFMFVGIAVAILGAVLGAASDSDAASIGMVLGGAIFLFGLVAKAIQIGVRSSRD